MVELHKRNDGRMCFGDILLILNLTDIVILIIK